MGKIYEIRMNCVGLKDYAVEARSKKEAREIIEKQHHQCNGTEFEFGEFLEVDSYEKQAARKQIEENFGQAVEL